MFLKYFDNRRSLEEKIMPWPFELNSLIQLAIFGNTVMPTYNNTFPLEKSDHIAVQ